MMQEQLRNLAEQRKNVLFSAFAKPKKPELSFVEWVQAVFCLNCFRIETTNSRIDLKSLIKVLFVFNILNFSLNFRLVVRQ